MLVGRDAERARLDAVLEAARERRSSSLVLRGEAGIGKTVLLEYAIEQAEGFRALRALGVESEAELAFAGVQQLVRPILDCLSELPRPQARALGTALALEEGPPPEGLAVSLAVLSLLAAAADEQPLLCVVDDAHWLDRASAEALTFVARRLQAERVVMLFAAREPETATFAAPGLPELTVLGLPPAEARALLSVTTPALADRSAERLVEVARGNPLALLEIPRAMSPEQRAGRDPPDKPLPVGAEIQRVFVARAHALSPEAQSALLLVAAGDPGDAETFWKAIAAADLEGRAVAEAQAAGLLRRERLDFCHPLARSAVYQTAPPADRRAAHAALARVTLAPDRRAWHLAAAAEHPDEAVAKALEAAASDARRRGGVTAEARALEQAARLTADDEPRARRLLEAALAAEAGGWLDHAEAMLAEVASLTEDAALRARAIARRSYLLFDQAEFVQAHSIAMQEAERAAPQEAALVLTGVVRVLTRHFDVPAALATAQRALALAGSSTTDPTNEAVLDFLQNLAWTQALAGQVEEPLALVRELVSRVDPGSLIAIDVANVFLYLEDYETARELLEGVVERSRAADAPGVLYYALDQLAKVETRAGSLTRAYALELECLGLTPPGDNLGVAACLAWLGLVEGMLGRAEAHAHTEEALRKAEPGGDHYNAVRARGALGLQALALGEPSAALDWLKPAVTMLTEGGVQNPNWFRVDADLIEALTRVDRIEEARRHLSRLEEQSEATHGRWARAAAARCRAFLSEDGELPNTFDKALKLHDDDTSAFERARTELCYGERLRRAGQRRSARAQLRTALETFERIGAEPWAERSRVELRATGEHIRRRDPTTPEQLTPQELQIALVVAEGMTNREIAARLFLSPKTVEFHLTRIYRKLAIHSRSELVRRMLSVDAGALLSSPPTAAESVERRASS
jgi:DNA-binding CsgD family transcriptional regulator